MLSKLVQIILLILVGWRLLATFYQHPKYVDKIENIYLRHESHKPTTNEHDNKNQLCFCSSMIPAPRIKGYSWICADIGNLQLTLIIIREFCTWCKLNWPIPQTNNLRGSNFIFKNIVKASFYRSNQSRYQWSVIPTNNNFCLQLVSLVFLFL